MGMGKGWGGVGGGRRRVVIILARGNDISFRWCVASTVATIGLSYFFVTGLGRGSLRSGCTAAQSSLSLYCLEMQSVKPGRLIRRSDGKINKREILLQSPKSAYPKLAIVYLIGKPT